MKSCKLKLPVLAGIAGPRDVLESPTESDFGDMQLVWLRWLFSSSKLAEPPLCMPLQTVKPHVPSHKKTEQEEIFDQTALV